MKYPLNEELHLVAKHKIPADLNLLPAMNKALQIFQCRPDGNVDVTHYKIKGYEDYELPVVVIEPKQKEKRTELICLIFFHGGGFMLRSSGAHFHLLKEYAVKLPCKVVYVDYRLAPDFPYPIPAEDCYCAYQWVLKRADKLNTDPKRILIGGDSAGGNLAAVVSLMARDRGLPIPAGAMLIYPVTDRRMETESMKNYTDTPVWDANLTKLMWEAYLGEQQAEPIWYVSPMEADSLAEFPSTYLEAAEFDCLHDEGILFGERLKAEGIEVEIHDIEGACHGYEGAVRSRLVRDCVERRLEWMRKMTDDQESELDMN